MLLDDLFAALCVCLKAVMIRVPCNLFILENPSQGRWSGGSKQPVTRERRAPEGSSAKAVRFETVS